MNNELIESRLQICKDCPLYTKNSFGWDVCNPNLYFNPETSETSKKKKSGFVNGCGCKLSSLISNENNHCHANKW